MAKIINDNSPWRTKRRKETETSYQPTSRTSSKVRVPRSSSTSFPFNEYLSTNIPTFSFSVRTPFSTFSHETHFFIYPPTSPWNPKSSQDHRVALSGEEDTEESKKTASWEFKEKNLPVLAQFQPRWREWKGSRNSAHCQKPDHSGQAQENLKTAFYQEIITRYRYNIIIEQRPWW